MKFIFWIYFISIGNIYSLFKKIVLYIFHIYKQGYFFSYWLFISYYLTIWIECITTQPLKMESGPLRDVLDTTLWDKALSVTCGGSVGFPVIAVSSTNKSDRQNIIEIWCQKPEGWPYHLSNMVIENASRKTHNTMDKTMTNHSWQITTQ